MKVIPKRLWVDTKLFGNSRGRGTHRKHLQDFQLLRGERRNRRSSADHVIQIGNLLRNGDYSAEDFLALLLRTDVTHQMNKEGLASPPVQMGNGRKIDPDPLLATGSHIQVEILQGTRGICASQRSTAFMADIRT